MKIIPGGIAEKRGKVCKPNLKAMDIASRTSQKQIETVVSGKCCKGGHKK